MFAKKIKIFRMLPIEYNTDLDSDIKKVVDEMLLSGDLKLEDRAGKIFVVAA